MYLSLTSYIPSIITIPLTDLEKNSSTKKQDTKPSKQHIKKKKKKPLVSLLRIYFATNYNKK